MENPITEFDTLTFSHSLQMLKAALPYMETASQKNLIMFIKIFELKNAMSLLSEDNNQLSACSNDDDENRMINMLNHLRQFCTAKEREFIDLFINFNQAFQLFSSYKATMPEDAAPSSSMFDILKNMLSPEQQAAFEGYSQMFASNT